jgi:GTP-binding protein LepA
LKNAKPEEVMMQMEALFGVDKNDILKVSAKLGTGVEDLLDSIVERVPPPRGDNDAPLRALVFDSWYNQFVGMVSLVVVLDGRLKSGDKIQFFHGNRKNVAHELGLFTPEEMSVAELR